MKDNIADLLVCIKGWHRNVQAGIGPVESLLIIIQGKTIRPHQTAVNNLSPEISAQSCTFNLSISSPVSPVHVSKDRRKFLNMNRKKHVAR